MEAAKPWHKGYDRHWEALRSRVLAEQPLCQDCADAGFVVAAREVHHIKRVRDYPSLRLDRRNLRALCRGCHQRRTNAGE
jgi:5-methylcytosine-specific restriction enzyme A